MENKYIAPIEKYDAILVGNIAKEIIIDYLGNVTEREGGALVYAASACISNGAIIAISTKLAKEDLYLLDPLKARFVDLYEKFNGQTAIIEQRLQSFTHKSYITKCIRQGAPFHDYDIAEEDTYYYLFLNDFYGEMSLDLLAYFSHKAKIALDASCYVRQINKDTKEVEISDYRHKKYLASLCDVFKATLEEAKVLTGVDDPKQMCQIIKSWGANEVLITGDKLLYLIDSDGNFYTCPICEFSNVGQLYCDTTAFAVYVTQRITSDPDTALYSAAALAMIKLQRTGPIKCTRPEINLNLDTFYYHRHK